MKDLVPVPEPGARVGWSQGWDLHYRGSALLSIAPLPF